MSHIDRFLNTLDGKYTETVIDAFRQFAHSIKGFGIAFLDPTDFVKMAASWLGESSLIGSWVGRGAKVLTSNFIGRQAIGLGSALVTKAMFNRARDKTKPYVQSGGEMVKRMREKPGVQTAAAILKPIADSGKEYAFAAGAKTKEATDYLASIAAEKARVAAAVAAEKGRKVAAVAADKGKRVAKAGAKIAKDEFVKDFKIAKTYASDLARQAVDATADTARGVYEAGPQIRKNVELEFERRAFKQRMEKLKNKKDSP
eukprot:jgi/Mesvir1/15742/Mv03315-RA.1